MPICPVTKKTQLCTRYKNTHFFAAILLPFGPGRQNFNRMRFELGLGPTYASKILSGSVKVYRSYSRKADFKQKMHITLSCVLL